MGKKIADAPINTAFYKLDAIASEYELPLEVISSIRKLFYEFQSQIKNKKTKGL